MSKTLLLLLLLFSFYSCEAVNGNRVFEIAQSNTDLEVRAGEVFGLKFHSNPSTGYSWHFLNQEENDETIKFIETKFVNPYDKQIIGKGGLLYYYFKALKVSNEEITLKFSYSRSFKNDNPAATHLIKIKVY